MITLQDKFNKLYSARAKLEAELNNIYGQINNAVDKQHRKVDLAQKTEDPNAACKNLEKCLETVTKKTDDVIAAA